MAHTTNTGARAVLPSGDGTSPGISCPLRLLQGAAVLVALVVFGFLVVFGWSAALESVPQPHRSPTTTGCDEQYGVPCAIGGVR